MNKKEIKATLILIVSFFIFIALSVILVTKVNLNSRTGIICLIIFLIYLILAFALSSRFGKSNNKIIIALLYIFCFPAAVIHFISQFINPFLVVILNFFMYLALSSIPAIVVLELNKVMNIHILREKSIFILFASVSIIAVFLNRRILKFICKWSTAIRNQSEVQAIKSIKLTQDLFNRENVRFVIYLLYFLFLIFYSWSYLNGVEEITYFAIMQAFLAFLAFDSIVVNSKKISTMASNILLKMVEIFISDAEEDVEKDGEANNEK